MELKESSRLAYDLRKLTVDMIVAGNGGHIGGDMSVMEILVTLYFDQMNVRAENENDPERDMFVMSKGHLVEAYYAVLAGKGFLDADELKAKEDKSIVVLCSDSRGSALLAPFADAYPEQFVEIGIAEQDLVSAGYCRAVRHSEYARIPSERPLPDEKADRSAFRR